MTIPLRLSILALAAASLFAANPEELLKADRAFAAEAAARGVDGFADWMAERGIYKFQGKGKPLTTREDVRAAMKKDQGNRKFTLRWQPVKAEIASSGDLGFTYGTWTAGEKNEVTGHYLTVWKRQKDGSWKVVADAGQPD